MGKISLENVVISIALILKIINRMVLKIIKDLFDFVFSNLIAIILVFVPMVLIKV